jgi:hypothetical protein
MPVPAKSVSSARKPVPPSGLISRCQRIASTSCFRRGQSRWSVRAHAKRRLVGVADAAPSLRPDAGRPDYLAPFLSVVCEELAEVRRRTSQQRAAELD